MIRIILLGLSAVMAAGLLFVNVYNSVIDAANWGAALPHSIVAAREYFKVANPGNFFRIASPINQVLALTAVILCWKLGRARYIALSALVLTIFADLFTFGYFYPRLEVMFAVPFEASADRLRLAWEQWSTMNWARSALCAGNAVLAMSLVVITSKKTEL